jgi:hopanoid biosynthesis associated protein HpnK
MLHLIVNADDFGLSEKVNEGILKAHRNGIVTSTSLMATGAAFEHAVAVCRSAPTLDVGIHLTLVEEPPVLASQKILSLVDGEGRLHPHAKIFVRKYFSGHISVHEIKNELEAQIRKVMSQGIKVSHLDGHQHLHMLPGILQITVGLAKKYGIPGIRLPNETLYPYMLRNLWKISRVLELMTLKVFCLTSKKAEMLRPKYFVGFFFGGNLNKKNLIQILENLPRTGTCELMCHPGNYDPDTRYSHWDYHCKDELNALTDPEIVNFLKREGISLTSYRELANVERMMTQ